MALLASVQAAASPGVPAEAPVRIGPWAVQAWDARPGVFSHCTLHRLDNGFVAAFSRGVSGYALALGSIRWRLPEKGTFSVLLVAGAAQIQTQAQVTGPTVLSIGLQRNPALVPRIVNEFKAADSLEIRIGTETFRIPSDGAGPALAELDRCWREHQHFAEAR